MIKHNNNFDNFAPFLDPIGRLSDKSFHEEEGITDNPLLFTGEAALLLQNQGKLGYKEVMTIFKVVRESTVEPGLYRRQPEAYQKQYNIPWNSVSHDEYNGMCFMVAACPDSLRFIACDIVQYGQRNEWQFNDLNPRQAFWREFWDSPIKIIKEVRAYLADEKANPNDTNSVDLRHPGYINSLFFTRQPRDIAFYKIAAAIRPTFFEALNLALAIQVNANADIIKTRGGTMLMAWFRNIALKKLKVNSFIVQYSIKLWEKRMTKKYGANYHVVLAERYFDRKGPNGEEHTLLTHIRNYKKD